MSNFILGDLDTKFKVGGDDCSIYLGTTKLYPKELPKYVLTLSDSSVVSATCDGTSAVTRSETSAYTATCVSVVFGDCIETIGSSVFYDSYANSTLTSVTIPDSVTSIESAAFWACENLSDLTIGSGLTSIGNYAFNTCKNLSSITLPDSVSSIGNYAFTKCSSLSSFTFPTSLTVINDGVFSDCGGLTSITIPSRITNIGNSAFRYCSGLTEIIVESTTPPTLGTNVFGYSSCPILVPSASVNAYKSASGWSTYASRIQAIP